MPLRILLLSVALLAASAATAAEKSRTESRSTNPDEKSGAAVPAPLTYAEALARGDAAWRANDIDRAMLHYGQAAQLDAKADLPLLRMASLEEGRKGWARAHQLFEMALQRVPDNAAALERLGFVLLREGDHEGASARFTEAASKDPQRWRAVMGLGLAAQMRGDLPAAQKHFEYVLARRAQDAEVLAYSASLWLQQGNSARALTDARESQRLQPRPATQLLLGDALARSADYAGALEAYLGTLNEPDAYLRLGDEALRARELQRAQRYFQSALDNSPVYNELAAKRLAVAREHIAEAGQPAGRPGR